jgi:hypothetical protein
MSLYIADLPTEDKSSLFEVPSVHMAKGQAKIRWVHDVSTEFAKAGIGTESAYTCLYA